MAKQVILNLSLSWAGEDWWEKRKMSALMKKQLMISVQCCGAWRNLALVLTVPFLVTMT